MTKIFVTLISFNNSTATIECLESLEKVKKNNFDLSVIVIDNASVEIFRVDKKYNNFDLKILRSEQNLGFSGGQNLGIKYALEHDADYVVILNNDVIVDPNLIIDLFTSFKEKVGIVSPKIYFAKGFEFHKDRYKQNELGHVFWYAGGIMDWNNVIGRHRGVDEVDIGQYDSISATEYATGCCMMVKKDVFEKIGRLDDKYFLYYEDTDFSLRAERAGYEILYQPKAVLWHKNAVSAGGSGSFLQDYYITRNRLLFGFRYANLKVKIALIKESLKLFLIGRKWQKKGIRDFYLGKFGKGTYKNE